MGEVLGLRTEERRHGDDRRHGARGVGSIGERRKAKRRRTVRSLAFGLFAMAVPGTGASTKLADLNVTEAVVSVSENFRALPANIAYNDVIAEAARIYKLDPDLIRAIIRAESAFNPFAVSAVGAQGLMQLMPDVAAELDVFDPFDPRQNILGGARICDGCSIGITATSTSRWRATMPGRARSIGSRAFHLTRRHAPMCAR